MSATTDVGIAEFQAQMQRLYEDRDRERGLAATIAWLAEEVGELAQATRKGTLEQRRHELGDVLAWLASLANQLEIDLASCVQRFMESCPHCGSAPCSC